MTGNRATNVFVREDNGTYYLAVFNFNGEVGVSKSIHLNRVAGDLAGATTVSVTDVWTDKSLGFVVGTLNLVLDPAESKLLKLVPVRRGGGVGSTGGDWSN